MRLDKSIMILELKVHFLNCRNSENTLFHIETRLNAEIRQINLLEESWGYTYAHQTIILCLLTADVSIKNIFHSVHDHSLYGGSGPSLFKAPTPWPSLPPPPFLKSLFPLSSFLFHPLLSYFRQFPQTSHNLLLP